MLIYIYMAVAAEKKNDVFHHGDVYNIVSWDHICIVSYNGVSYHIISTPPFQIPRVICIYHIVSRIGDRPDR